MAAPTRSSATSSPSARWACRANRAGQRAPRRHGTRPRAAKLHGTKKKGGEVSLAALSIQVIGWASADDAQFLQPGHDRLGRLLGGELGRVDPDVGILRR